MALIGIRRDGYTTTGSARDEGTKVVRRSCAQLHKTAHGSSSPWICLRCVLIYSLLNINADGYLPIGGSGGVVNDWFFNVQVDADLELFGSGDKRWSWVHVDDLGEGYLKIAQAGSVVDHQVFNLGTLGTYREIC